MNGTKLSDFRYILVEDTYVVWLAGANRFLQLKEPAFFVFNAWASKQDLEAIAGECVTRYDLSPVEALRFTNEIITETEKLNSEGQRAEGKEQTRPVVHSSSLTLVRPDSRDFTCRILGKTILFVYGGTELEELFRPLFRQFEIAQGEGQRAEGNRICFFRDEGNFALRVDDQEPQLFAADDIEHFQGAFLLELLNILHGKTPGDWMGVFHASAVSDGEKALLFMGDSGTGKSTLAALLVAHGFRLVSDDFVAVSVTDRKVFPLPSALSVKKGALPVLEHLFPVLQNRREEWDGESELFLPLPEESIERSPVSAAAIIFARYDPSVAFSLTRESNLERMNALLRQSWIPGEEEAVQSFLEWYFALPVYSLTYSDTGKAISGIKRNFEVDKDTFLTTKGTKEAQ